MNSIDENSNKKTDSFYERLSEDGVFDYSKFYLLIKEINALNNSHISEIDRIKISNNLYLLLLNIQFSISCHFNSKDVFQIDNILDDQLVEVGNFLTYIGCSFANGTEIDLNWIKDVIA